MPTQRIQSLDSKKLQQIVNAALEEFSEFHFHDASYNRIIKKSGLSKGSMYYYFESKEDLFLALMNRSFDKLSGMGKKTFCMETPEHFWLETKRLLAQLFDFLDRQPKLGRFMLKVLAEHAKTSQTPAASLLLKVEEWVADFLVAGQVSGAVRRDLPIDLMIALVWSVWETLGKWLATEKNAQSVDPEKRAEALLDFYLRALEP